MYHVPFAFQYIYGGSAEGDEKVESKISGGGERVEIAWPFVCR